MFNSARLTPTASASASAVALRDVRKVYGRGDGAVAALDGVSAALAPGSFTAIMGPTGATTRQVRSMARWEAILIITIGLGIGLAIAATALLPLSHALTGGFRPYAPAGWLAAILGVSALLALVALSVPTRRALRTRPVEAIGIRE